MSNFILFYFIFFQESGAEDEAEEGEEDTDKLSLLCYLSCECREAVISHQRLEKETIDRVQSYQSSSQSTPLPTSFQSAIVKDFSRYTIRPCASIKLAAIQHQKSLI